MSFYSQIFKVFEIAVYSDLLAKQLRMIAHQETTTPDDCDMTMAVS